MIRCPLIVDPLICAEHRETEAPRDSAIPANREAAKETLIFFTCSLNLFGRRVTVCHRSWVSALLNTEFPWGERGEGSTQNYLSHFKRTAASLHHLARMWEPQLQTILAEAL